MRFFAFAFSIVALATAGGAAGQIEDVKTAAAGGQIYQSADAISGGGARLLQDASWGKGIFKSEYPAGTELVSVQTKTAFKACKAWARSSSLEPCFLDDDGDGKFDRMAANTTSKAWSLDAPLPYERDAFKRVFLFQGATSDSLRFSYREFATNRARPAFTEELVLPREPFPQMVALKALQIEVLGVDGMGLRYRITSESNAGP